MILFLPKLLSHFTRSSIGLIRAILPEPVIASFTAGQLDFSKVRMKNAAPCTDRGHHQT